MLVGQVQRDEYQWRATLTFDGPPTPVIHALARNLKELKFVVDDRLIFADPITECVVGSLAPDGTGECEFDAGNWGGGGKLQIEIKRPAAVARGTITLHREFEHRMDGDRIGPPYPPRRGE